MVEIGRVETLSTEFAMGWASLTSDQTTVVCARLNGAIIGTGRADLTRPDLEAAAARGRPSGAGFIIIFERSVPADKVGQIEVVPVFQPVPLPRIAIPRIDRAPKLQVLIFGSPRSGTSELGNTVARELTLPWLGEGHAAPLFAAAANSLSGNEDDPNGMVRLMARLNYRHVVVNAARRVYYTVHASASFLDKTPGVPMINAAPFLAECFPDAKFINIRRNGISNVLSRMKKFGGNFDAHCADWAAAVNRWEQIRSTLPHFLELEQEQMLNEPDQVARKLADYLGTPEAAGALETSLSSNSLERTGAGLGRSTLAQTEWTPMQINTFRRICGPTMEKLGYEL